MKDILKYLLIITIINLYPLWSYGYTGMISGKVINAKTGEPLPGVNIMIEHTTIGSATNNEGHYTIRKVPKGKFNLSASMIGYKTERKEIHLKPNRAITVDFELEQIVLGMGAIVVTGTSTPHLVEDAPVRTEVITRLSIEKKQVCNLSEALSFQTGIRVENNCQNCNFSQVRILGLDGKYSQILVDGDPVISSLASVYGLEHFPEEMIDHIEIVKGGGSSLYGGGAVAGVINMITRKPILNQTRIKYLGNSINGKMDQHIGVIAEKVNDEGTAGTYIFASYRDRTPYDYNNDGFSELGELLNESIGFKWYYQPIEDGEFTVSFHRIHEERRGGNKFDQPVHEAEIAEWIEHWRSGGTVRWEYRPTPLFDYHLYYSFSLENRKSYYGGLGGYTGQDTLEALNFYGKTDNPLHISGAQTNYRLGSHLFTFGAQYIWDKLKDETAAETVYHIDNIYTNIGVFLQDNLQLGKDENIEMVIGFRVDKHSELGNWIFSPRVNGKFKINGVFTVRGTYTTGFKPPQIYDEDLHLCGIEGDQRIIRNAENLKEERSHFLSTGLEYNGFLGESIPMMFSLTGFRSQLDGCFTEKFVSKQGAIERWERINSDGAIVNGIEIDVGIQLIDVIEIRSGFTYKKSEYDKPHEDFDVRNFLRVPDLTGNFQLFINPTKRLSLNIRSDYIGSAYVPHEIVIEGEEEPELQLEKSDNFFQVDIGLAYQMQINKTTEYKLNFGVRNITNAYQRDLDIGHDRDPAYVYGPARPRTFYLGLDLVF